MVSNPLLLLFGRAMHLRFLHRYLVTGMQDLNVSQRIISVKGKAEQGHNFFERLL